MATKLKCSLGVGISECFDVPDVSSAVSYVSSYLVQQSQCHTTTDYHTLIAHHETATAVFAQRSFWLVSWPL